MGDVHVDDAKVRMPLIEQSDGLSLIPYGANDERPVTEGQANDLGEDRSLQNCEDAYRCPQLARIRSAFTRLPSPLHVLLKSLL